jgi:hypothetical protein
MDSTLSKKLEDLINSNIDKANLPYVKGNSIRIKNMVIRKSKVGWLVYDTETNKQVGRYFCRSSALAYANSVIKGRKHTRQILELDHFIEKHYNDCVFYLHTLRKTKDATRKEVARIRYDISYAETKQATKDLERFIFI